MAAWGSVWDHPGPNYKILSQWNKHKTTSKSNSKPQYTYPKNSQENKYFSVGSGHFSHRQNYQCNVRIYLQIYFSEVNEGHLLLQHLLWPSFLFLTIVNAAVPFFLSLISSVFHVPFSQGLHESRLEESCVLLHLFHIREKIHRFLCFYKCP